MSKLKIRPYLEKRKNHTGFPYAIKLQFGNICAGRYYNYLWCLLLTLKLNNVEYSVGFRVFTLDENYGKN